MKSLTSKNESRVAIVTGGTKNIGLSICKALLDSNIKVAFLGSTEESVLNAAQNELQEYVNKNQAQGFLCDLSDVENIPSLINSVSQKFGQIDIIINAAGILDISSVEETSEEIWKKVLAVNLSSPFFLIQNALPFLKNSNAARVINIASNAGRMGGYANGMSYTASKGGLISLTYGLARQLAKWKITVNCVAPGTIDSDMLKSRDTDTKAELLKKFPLGRYGECHEVAEAVMYFVSANAGFTTGAVLDVNGGLFTG